MTAPGGANPLSEGDTRDAVAAALGAEHAAIWCYGLASAYLPAASGGAEASAIQAHRERRDTVTGLLRAAGAPVPVAAASYRTPAPLTDGASAAGLLVVAEDDIATAWRAVVERTDDPGLRNIGVDAVVAAATARVRWRVAAGGVPTVQDLLGT